jgi:hypothetical protein
MVVMGRSWRDWSGTAAELELMCQRIEGTTVAVTMALFAASIQLPGIGA